jgi:diguanylate cyclase (GGDEF)-like protein/PAS domain S-box-containing protein
MAVMQNLPRLRIPVRREFPRLVRRKLASALPEPESFSRYRARRIEDAQRIARLGGWVLDHLSGKLTWSDEVFRLFEIAPERFDGTYQSFITVVHPDDRDQVNQAFAQSLASRTPYEITHRLLMPDGRIKWLNEKCETDFDGAGNPLQSYGMVQDVTERHEALIALQASEARFRSIFESTNTGIASTDSSGRVTSFNESFRAMLGYDAALLRNMNFAELTYPDDLPRETGFFNEILAGKREHYHIEKRYIESGGGILWVDISVAVVRSAEGRAESFVAVVVDISDRKQAESALRASHETLLGILGTTLDGYWCTDGQGRLLDVNPAYCRQSGYTREELLRMRIPDLEAAENPAETAAHLRHLMQHGCDLFESKHRRKDGSVWDVEISATYRSGLAGGQLFVFVRDITERKRADAEVRIAAATFESQDGIIVTDANSVILRVNRAFSQITGYTAEEVVGRKPHLFKSDRHDAEFFRSMWDTIHRTGGWQGEIWDRRKNGEIYPKWLTITAVRDSKGIVTHYVGTHSDITERKRAEEQVRQLAFYDTLTQLPNRRLFNDRLIQTMAANKRNGCHGALIFIDLDNFKPLNDTYGHAVGDLLLIEAADRLRGCVREMDTVSRFGGDEFVVMLGQLANDRDGSQALARGIAEKIRARLAAPYCMMIENQEGAEVVIEHLCSASIGAALFIGQASTPDDILKQADMAMYQAKESGRNSIRFHELSD